MDARLADMILIRPPRSVYVTKKHDDIRKLADYVKP
jgi:hypothetical protein